MASRPAEPQELLQLVGSEILAIATGDRREVEGGGLIVDYRRPGEQSTRRIIFAFNELGMWVESESPL